MSRCSTSFGSACASASSISPSSRAARAESSRGRASGRPLLRFRPRRARRLRRGTSPYSLSFSPMRMARCRSATLCSLLPVKYCIAAPKLSCSSARTSTCRPSRPNFTLVLLTPRPEHFMNPRIRRDAIQRRRRIRAGDEQIEIADRLASAPQTSRRRDRFDAVADPKDTPSARARRCRRSSAGSGRCAP